MASPAISALHIYDFFWVCSMDDMDLCHGQNSYATCSRVLEVNYSMVTSLSWKDHILNVIDTPGHDDFLGEVRQGVSMADGAIFVVDVNEGLKGQARFVAEAIKSRLSIILLLNKVDLLEVSALEERCVEIVTQVGDVLIDNDATEDELNFPVLHASAKDGWALLDLAHDAKDMSQLLEEIIKCVPAPATTRLQEPFQMLVSMISKDDKWGRFMIGRIAAGVISQNDKVKAFRESNTGVVVEEGRVLKIMKRAGLDGVIVEKASVGDIVSLGGLKSVQVGDTLAHMEVMTCVPPLVFDKPKICMVFGVNDSPVAGQDGKKVSIRQLYDRLDTILDRNPAFKVYREGASVAVRGQGERQMGILLEMVRREGVELLVSRQQLTDGKDEAAVPTLRKGVMVSNASGRVSEAALMRLQHLGTFFVSPGDEAYSGMIVGEHSQDKDIKVNPVQSKGPTKNAKLLPTMQMSLEEALNFVAYDEEIEVTPHAIRLRKK